MNEQTPKKILILASHPDDEVLGCGGVIAKYTENNDEVYLCIFTVAYLPDWSAEFLEKRKIEIKKASEILGIKKIYELNFPTAKLDIVPQKEINDKLAKVVKEIEPDIMFIPHQGDLSCDHRLVFNSALVVSRPLKSTVKKILSYETLSETEYGQAIKPFLPNVYTDISNTLNKKLQAMQVYSSEVKEFPHPRSLQAIEALAKKRGSETSLKLAEAFMLIREITA